MENQIKNYITHSKYYWYIRDSLSSFLILLIILVLGGLTAYSINSYVTKLDSVSKIQTDVDALNKNVQILKNNKVLTQDQIDDFNTVLNQLIPESEDYFSLILALEKISDMSKFTVSKYAVNLSNTTPEKLAITVEGDGNTLSFLEFLKNYQYGGGRLITNERIEFSSSELGKIRISLNFYNKKAPTTSNTFTPVTKEDIAMMQSIKAKTEIMVKSDPTKTQDYPTSPNPF